MSNEAYIRNLSDEEFVDRYEYEDDPVLVSAIKRIKDNIYLQEDMDRHLETISELEVVIDILEKELRDYR